MEPAGDNARLDLHLLGTFEATLDGAPLLGFRSDKVRALLAYLVTEPHHPHRRDVLATLLWGGFPDRAARRSLSQALSNLRRLLAPLELEEASVAAREASARLTITRHSVAFEPGQNVRVDAHVFDTLLASRGGYEAPGIATLTQATAVYRGPFLAGLSLPDCPEFEEWRLLQAEQRHQAAILALEQLATHHLSQRELQKARHYARRQIALEPWRESAHRQLMLALALDGQRGAALQQYDTCIQQLAEEMGVGAEPETIALREQIWQGELPGTEALPAPDIVEHPLPPSPYRGLFAFGQEDARWYFGREAFVRRLVDAVAQWDVVAVIGPSGSGKSSAVFAGLLPRLLEEGGPGDATKKTGQWQIASLRPGARPIEALAGSLVSALAPEAKADVHLAQAARLSRILGTGSKTLCQAIAMIRAEGQDAGPRQSARRRDTAPVWEERLLLVVDQFEELYTLCSNQETRENFLHILLSDLAREQAAPCTLLLTLRADFMGQVLAHRPLADALQDGGLILGPMTREELARAVEQPAQVQGVSFEPGLVERILQEVGKEPGNLPLLQFALTALWERQAGGRQLTHAAYDATGGFYGALANYAEDVYSQFEPAEQEAVRRVLVHLIRPGRNAQDTRGLATRVELGDEDWVMVQRLADARLVVTGRDPAGQETAELVHEALIDGWGRLDSWLNEDRAFRIWWERLRSSLRTWIASDRDEDALLRGNQLAEAEEWLDGRGVDLSPIGWEYIVAGIANRERERKAARNQRQRELDQAQALANAERQRADAERHRADVQVRSSLRLRRLTAGLAAVFLVALAAASLAFLRHQEADRQAYAAVAWAATAEAERVRAEDQAQVAEAERSRAEEQARLALSRQLAAQAVTLLDKELDLALLLNLEARRLAEPGPERGAYLSSLAYGPYLSRFLHGHEQPVLELGRSPDGQTLTSVDSYGQVVVWDLATGQPLRRLPPQEAEATGAVSANGRVAAVAQEQDILLWDTTTGRPLGPALQAHSATIKNLSLNAEGSVLVSGDSDGTIHVWDIPPLALEPRVLAQPLAYDGTGIMAMRPDGQHLAMAAKGSTLDVWDLQTGELVGRNEAVHPGYALHNLVYGPDGQVLATSSFDKTIMLWDAKTLEALGPPLKGHDGRVLASTFSPDGRTLASVSTDNTLRLWDLSPMLNAGDSGAPGAGNSPLANTGGFEAQPLGPPLAGHSNWVRSVTFLSDSSSLASGDSEGKTIIWEVGRSRRLAGHQAQVRGLAFSPDGRTLASGSLDTNIVLWDTATGQPASQPLTEHPKNVLNLAYSPDGRHIASVGAGRWVILWELGGGDGAPRAFPLDGHTGQVYAVAFSPDGRTLATGSRDSSIILWDVESREVLGLPLEGHESWVLGLTFSPDSRVLASASADGTARLWDVSGLRAGESARGTTGGGTAKGLRSGVAAIPEPRGLALLGHGNWVNGVAFSPDGTLLATASSDNTVRLWDPQSCLEPGAGDCEPLGAPLTGHAAQVWSVVFHPAGDGQFLVSGGANGTVLVWDLATREPLGPPLLGGIEMETMALNPDGSMVALGALDTSGLVHLWQLDLTPWETRACAIANRNLTEAEWRRYLGDLAYQKTCPHLP